MSWFAGNPLSIGELFFGGGGGGGTAPINPPVFTQEPQSQTANDSGSAAFTTAVDNANSYQWYKNGLPVGSISQPYTATGLTSSDNGSVVWCKATSDGGIAYSDLALITVENYVYSNNGTNQYASINTLNPVPASTPFEISFSTYIYSVAGRNFLGASTSNKSGLIAWSDTGTVSIRVDNTWKATPTAIPQTIGLHTIRVKREATTNKFFYKIDSGVWYDAGFTSTSIFNTEFLARAYGSSSYLYLNGNLFNIKIWSGGDTSTGTLILDIPFNKKGSGAAQPANVGSGATMVNYNEASWTLLGSQSPIITKQPTTKSVEDGGTAAFSITATGVNSYAWYKGETLVSSTSSYISSFTSADNGVRVYCILTGDGGVTMSNLVSVQVESFTQEAMAAYSFDTVVTAGSVTSWSDYTANERDITSMLATVNGRTINGVQCLDMVANNFVNLPSSINTNFAGDNSLYIVAALDNTTSSSEIFKASGTGGEVSIVVDPLNSKVTFKHGTESVIINKVIDNDSHIFGFERSGALLTAYVDTLSATGASTNVSVTGNAVVCGSFDGALCEILVFNKVLSYGYKQQELGVIA